MRLRIGSPNFTNVLSVYPDMYSENFQGAHRRDQVSAIRQRQYGIGQQHSRFGETNVH